MKRKTIAKNDSAVGTDRTRGAASSLGRREICGGVVELRKLRVSTMVATEVVKAAGRYTGLQD